MAEKIDFKKEYKDLYFPGKSPVRITVPEMNFFMADGEGAPDGEDYQSVMSALYSLTFTIKMSKMKGPVPLGYVDYVLPPLEGLWNCDGRGNYHPDRTRWKWTSLLRQPDFVTAEVFNWAKEEVKKKKPEIQVDRVRLERFDEGLCVQIMHVGPYSEEQASVEKLLSFMEQNALTGLCDGEHFRHHEIYLSDPRKIAPERLKTVLRHPVKCSSST